MQQFSWPKCRNGSIASFWVPWPDVGSVPNRDGNSDLPGGHSVPEAGVVIAAAQLASTNVGVDYILVMAKGRQEDVLNRVIQSSPPALKVVPKQGKA